VDFEFNWGKTVFLEFSQKEAVSGKTNYSPFSFSLGLIYEQNISEIGFSTCATKSRYWSVGSRS